MVFPPAQVFGRNKAAQPAPDQVGPRHPQQRGTRQVQLHDPALVGEGKVPHRAKIIEIQVMVPRLLQGQARPFQFLVLHLRLDLMHL